ncbi:MAG TPA: DUF5916 domain-containing protein, partial [Thermoanaerobaculia bacterium]|nr:DUF5916 domain-containing protein [Thermoanaerobaculia bacterium]
MLSAALLLATGLTINRLQAPIVIDGDVSDSGWEHALRIDTFVETAKGDNAAPPVRTVAWLAYDDRYLYAAFRSSDPKPAAIRAPFVDRDQVLPDQDYVAVMLDTQNDRRAAVVFRVNARGVQTDSIFNDGDQTEDFAPDFFYESAARINDDGWTAEMRIPLSSLRYPDRDPQSWGIILVRNYPRDFQYTMTSVHLPKGRNCYVCYAEALGGLTSLPRGGHMTVAPYSTAAHDEQWNGGQLTARPLTSETGADFKWSASPKLTVDATVNPDFSQIEADIPQVSANSRFAFSYAEKRPFFLEGVDLFSTPLKIVYTRSITAPAWGIRATGQSGSTAYTLLAAEDRGGGSVILPGPEGSSTIPQDFHSLVLIGRARTSIGKSFAGLLFTDREDQGGGHNRIIGPDFLWKIDAADRLLGQAVISDTTHSGSGHAGKFTYTRDKKYYDIWSQSFDYSRHFRADDGFVAAAGIHGTDVEFGAHVYPKRGFASYIRPFIGGGKEATWSGLWTGVYFEGKLGISGWFAFHPGDRDQVQGAFTRQYNFTEFHYKASPSMRLPAITLDGTYGERVDYANVRVGHGGSIVLTSSIRPTTHLELAASIDHEWLNVRSDPLYTADIDRLKATYVFDSRSLARLIVQRSNTDRTAWLYADPVSPRDGDLTVSALYGYRLNWQTTFYV